MSQKQRSRLWKLINQRDQKTHKTERPCIVSKNEPFEVVESFEDLGLEIPFNNKWHECAMRRLEARKRAYYAFENMCHQGGVKCWMLKKYLFDTLVLPVLLYGAEVWDGSISISTWKKFEWYSKMFLNKIFPSQETNTLPTSLTWIGFTSNWDRGHRGSCGICFKSAEFLVT